MHTQYAVPDRTLQPDGPISQLFLSEGVATYLQAVEKVHQLPYGRNSYLREPWIQQLIDPQQGAIQ